MYLRKDNTPYYVGKGKNYRAASNHSGFNPPKDKSRIRFIKENLSEDDAFMWEVFWIAEFGRIDLGTGCLHNKTDGGEGASGKILSDETKQKIRRASLGRMHSEETKQKLSEIKKGKTHTEEHKRKNSESKMGRTLSDEEKQKRSDANKGKKQPIVICPHCSKRGGSHTMKRWHFINCKLYTTAINSYTARK
jgi:hypothetical protein